jgi:hypothetical protein
MIFGKSDSPAPKSNSSPAAAPASPAAPAAPARPSVATAPAAPSSTAPAAAVAGQGERTAATIRYLDRPDIAETFADSITGLVFDGQTLRIEFGVTRLDEMKPNTPITGRRYPACRVVLPPAAAVDLINRMQQIAAALTQAGVVKAGPRPGETPQAG